MLAHLSSGSYRRESLNYWFLNVFLLCGRLYCTFYVVEAYNLGLLSGVQFLEAVFLQDSEQSSLEAS